MKKFFTIILATLTLGVVLTSCDTTPVENPSTKDTQSVVSEPNETVSTKVTEDTEPATIFQQFETVLIEKNIVYEKITTAAELVGAEQGVKYKLETESVEIYRFDASSDGYIEAEKTQSLQMEGFGAFGAVVTNGYAILSDNPEIVNIFKDIVNK